MSNIWKDPKDELPNHNTQEIFVFISETIGIREAIYDDTMETKRALCNLNDWDVTKCKAWCSAENLIKQAMEQ